MSQRHNHQTTKATISNSLPKKSARIIDPEPTDSDDPMDLEGELVMPSATQSETSGFPVAKNMTELSDIMFLARQKDVYEIEVTEPVLANIQKSNYNPEPKYMHYEDFTLYQEGYTEKVKARDGRSVRQAQNDKAANSLKSNDG